MDTTQPVAQTNYSPAPAAPGIFGTKIPSSVAFAVGILLFLLPFAEIKCGNTTLMNKTGLNYALANNWNPVGGYGKESMGEMTTKTKGEKEGSAQIFAIAALGLGVLGFLLSFTNAKMGGGGGIVTGILSGGALIGMMIEVKKWFNDGLAKQAADKAKEGTDSLGLDKIGNTMNPNLAFTPWFYVAVVAFLVAAFFCYKRMQSAK